MRLSVFSISNLGKFSFSLMYFDSTFVVILHVLKICQSKSCMFLLYL